MVSLRSTFKCYWDVRLIWTLSTARREMTLTARKQYIDAVKCLRKTKRFNSSLPLKFNRYDEYVISHMNVSDEVHGVVRIFMLVEASFQVNQEAVIPGPILALASSLRTPL